jgi:hypothetical protein
MKQIECAFEADVLAAVIQSRWPERVDPELREHAKTCQICSDVATVAYAIESMREETVADAAMTATIPDSGRVWWKAQIRARREAAEAVGRPITAVQIAAFACAIGLLGACIGATSSWFQTVVKGLWAELADVNFLTNAAGLITGHWLLALCMVTMILVIPVGVYLMVVRD